MSNFLNLQPEIFAVDVNDTSLRIVKLAKKHKGFQLVSFNEVKVQEGIVKEGIIMQEDALANLIKEACNTVNGKKLGTKYVIVALPEEKSFSQIIEMPKMTMEELRQAVPLEAENYIPLTIDKVYLDFQIINGYKTEADHFDLLINVMPRAVADSYVSCFKKAGLMPCVLEVESQAIVRALTKKAGSDPAAPAAPLIFIDLGNAGTTFIIFSGNSVRFTSSIPISSRQLTDAIASGLDISPIKAEELKIKNGLVTKKGDKALNVAGAMEPILSKLADEIKKYLAFYRDHVSRESAVIDGRIEKIILCGGGANLKELPDFLFKKLKIPVEVGDPFINIIQSKSRRGFAIPSQKALSFTTALGMALRAAEEKL